MTTKDYQNQSPLRIFLGYFRAHRRLFALDICCALGIAAIDLSFPLATRKALYDLLPNEKYGVFFAIMAIVVAFYVVRAFLNYIVCYFGHTFGIRVEADIRTDLFRHMQQMPMAAPRLSRSAVLWPMTNTRLLWPMSSIRELAVTRERTLLV